MDQQIDSRLFHEFHSRIAGKVALPQTCRQLLAAFAAPDVKADVVAAVVQRNQYLEHLLLAEIRALGLRENTPSLRAAIALLGMSKTRDLVCGVTLIRWIGGWHPTFAPSGKLALKPAELLKHALRAESVAAERAAGDTELAFCAGLLFDAMAAVGREVYGEPAGFADLLTRTFNAGLQAAELGQTLAAKSGLPFYSKQIFAACLVHDVGRLAQELLSPPGQAGSYAEFRKRANAARLSRGVAHFAETRRYLLGHEQLGSQLVFHFPRLRGLDRVVLFQYEPYLLKTSSPELCKFAQLVATAANEVWRAV